MNLVKLAEKLAAEAHQGQFRRDGITPYIEHPKAVASRVDGETEKAIAWLHDVLEDTEMSAQHLLEAGIPFEVVEAVSTLSRRSSETYMNFIRRVSNDSLATKVKVADLLSNLADSPNHGQIVRYAKALLELVS